MPPPLDLLDEITSLNAIYADNTFTLVPDWTSCSSAFTAILSPPAAVIHPAVSLRILFHGDYPTSAPEIVEGTTGGKGLSSDDVTGLARAVLSTIWMEGAVVMYELVEKLKEVLHVEPGSAPSSPSPTVEKEEEEKENDKGISTIDHEDAPAPTISSIPWFTTPPTVVSKSIFVARAISVTSPHQARAYIHELISTDRKVAKATHNITAYRIRQTDGITFQDNDDDGEDAAGSRLAYLLELIGIWNVLVVVSRWYGGVKLGPDRFRIINAVAREALVLGGLVEEKSGKENRKGKGKR